MTENDRDTPADHRHDKETASSHTEGTISTDQLFGGRDEVLIRHGDDTYRLRITRTGKLILHK